MYMLGGTSGGWDSVRRVADASKMKVGKRWVSCENTRALLVQPLMKGDETALANIHHQDLALQVKGSIPIFSLLQQ
ncbi:hypothetical protein BDA96_07G159400 [Sorghum bicolor]|uniref:Uncharacterized protein n=1 Tax=Sorghum bicolor TaxID=4558 RepID=A0A921QNK5_SORBI|nr:hypothetical protein BDA96_07G159400 [Sorghum bicolor]